MYYFLFHLVYCEEKLCREGFDGTISCASPLEDDFPQSAGLEESIERTGVGEEVHGKSHRDPTKPEKNKTSPLLLQSHWVKDLHL